MRVHRNIQMSLDSASCALLRQSQPDPLDFRHCFTTLYCYYWDLLKYLSELTVLTSRMNLSKLNVSITHKCKIPHL